MPDSIIGKISVGDGATFTPDVTDGVLSFTNNKNLPNPEPYNIAAKVLDEGENELRTLVTAAETAAGNAANSASTATTQANTAKAWATSTTSPDNAADTSSTTGKTQSAKSWAMYSKDRATASASSASAAATSAGAAKTAENNANASKTAAATSASNAATSANAAANSAKAAANSAKAAADSARVNQADWNVTDTNSKAFIKNKPDVYPNAEKIVTNGDERNLIRAAMATNDLFRLRVGGSPNEGWVELATGDDASEPIYVRQYSYRDGAQDTSFGSLRREAALLDASGNTSFPGTVTALNFTGLASKATADAAGNNIQTTYAKKSDLALASILVPTGCVQAFAGNTTPQGWLLCDGSAVSRTDYAALFAVIGTTYGSGNGSTTFNLPNLTDKFVEGSATAGTVKSAGLPNITGGFSAYTYTHGNSNGCVGCTDTEKNSFNLGSQATSSTRYNPFTINASRSSSIYGNSATVQPPALTMRYIIKY